MTAPTEKQVERARTRLRVAQQVLNGALDGLSQGDIAKRLGIDRKVISFWARALGVAPSREAGIGEGRSYYDMPL